MHGDGAFGPNAMKGYTAIRHKLPVLAVISLNRLAGKSTTATFTLHHLR